MTLNIAAFLPRVRVRHDKTAVPESAQPAIARSGTTTARMPRRALVGPEVIQPAARRSRTPDWLGLAWDRLGRGAAEPAVRVRPRASTLAAVALAGTAAGLIPPDDRALRGRPLPPLRAPGRRPGDDRAYSRNCDGRWSVASPWRSARCPTWPHQPRRAGAGRCCLLPDDWRIWSAAERRAVLAHELAHIVRGDYTTGLLARLAVVLNFYHPLVRFMAGRLQLQQEQAADAMGAQFAGGQGALPLGVIEPRIETRWTVPTLAGKGVPPGARDPDQEDRDVTG